ncbi:transposable element Tcb2 transposase [Trichonephila clavipes]|nr:transposable element Tcb2 transposase [Trichonephila clavipes]
MSCVCGHHPFLNGVVFLLTHMSCFSATSDSQRHLIWKDVEILFSPSNITERNRYRGPGVVIWGGIMLNLCTELPVFDKGSVCGNRCCKEGIISYVHLFLGVMGTGFIFMDNKTHSY